MPQILRLLFKYLHVRLIKLQIWLMWIKYLLVSFMLHNKEIRDFVDLRIPMQLVWVAAQKTGQRVKCQRSVNCGESLLIINSPCTALKKSKVSKILSFLDAIILNTWKEKLGWPQRKQHLSGHLSNHQKLKLWSLRSILLQSYIRHWQNYPDM